MKLSVCFTSLLFVVAVASTASAQSIPTLIMRCEEDSLNVNQARERVDWFLTDEFVMAKDHAQNESGMSLTDDQVEQWWVFTTQKTPFGTDRPRPLYPTFGVRPSLTNPDDYYAPPHGASTGAPMPGNYQIIGMCESSCYKPDGLLRFSLGEASFEDVEIAEALEQGLNSIAVLSEDSTLEAPELTSMPVYSYTMSATESEHEIYRFTTTSGGVLEVTDNHPVVDSTGALREAETFEVGQALVRFDGTLEAIVSIDVESYFGRVYNVAPATESLLGNVVVANGFLNGSSWYQNAGVEHLNARFLRGGLPDEILE